MYSWLVSVIGKSEENLQARREWGGREQDRPKSLNHRGR
jgi:hypothetical protein